MNSMYNRQLTSMIGLICLCLFLLGAGFFSLYYQYHIDELKKVIQNDITYISNYTSAVLRDGTDIHSKNFHNYLSSVALISDATVMLCEPDGKILFAAGSNFATQSLSDVYVPGWAVKQTMTNENYNGLTTFSGIFESSSYVTGVPIVTTKFIPESGNFQEQVCGIVFIAKDASSIRTFLGDVFKLFFITAVIVLLITMVICSLTLQRLIQPLKDMAAAAYRFAHGELDSRVTEYAKRNDEIGNLASAFNAMSESLAQSERQRSEFVANVSHELKTPMTTIAGFAEGILDGTIPPEREREFLTIISSETRRLARLVRRMLELSRLQSSERVAAQEQFDVSEVMLRVLVSLEANITEKGLEVQTELPSGAVMVWGDPDAITQVCYNLLDNAIKFSKEDGVLTIRIVSKAGKSYISVINVGETIPEEQLAHIFDRFHKADGSRSADRDGVGLGLYIVKTILNTHRESITVTSQEGVTEFMFTLSEV